MNKVQDFVNHIKAYRRDDAKRFKDFDLAYNVDTSHPLEIKNDGEWGPGAIENFEKYTGSNGYQNSALHEIDLINNYLKYQDGIEDYQFIDIGSGKGRVILYNLLKQSPYRAYKGIEIDSDLHSIAEHNLISTNIEISKEVTLINKDILDINLSYEPTVYFIFNPFSKEIFETFINKNLDIMIKSKSYLAFVNEHDYRFDLMTGIKPVLVDYTISIYYLGDSSQHLPS